MAIGELDLTVDGRSLSFEPAGEACPNCTTAPGYSHGVDVTTDSEALTVEVTFVCDGCGEPVETARRTAPLSDGDEPAEDAGGELVAWVEQYVQREGRPPSKSKCVQGGPFEVETTQELLEQLLEDGRLVTTEERRAMNRITVVEPA